MSSDQKDEYERNMELLADLKLTAFKELSHEQIWKQLLRMQQALKDVHRDKLYMTPMQHRGLDSLFIAFEELGL